MLEHLNLSPTNHRILSYLVQSPEELNEFEEWHLGNNRSIPFDIAAYRAVRTERTLAKLSVTEFVETYEQGDAEQKRDVLQRMFQQWLPIRS